MQTQTGVTHQEHEVFAVAACGSRRRMIRASSLMMIWRGRLLVCRSSESAISILAMWVSNGAEFSNAPRANYDVVSLYSCPDGRGSKPSRSCNKGRRIPFHSVTRAGNENCGRVYEERGVRCVERLVGTLPLPWRSQWKNSQHRGARSRGERVAALGSTLWPLFALCWDVRPLRIARQGADVQTSLSTQSDAPFFINSSTIFVSRPLVTRMNGISSPVVARARVLGARPSGKEVSARTTS